MYAFVCLVSGVLTYYRIFLLFVFWLIYYNRYHKFLKYSVFRSQHVSGNIINTLQFLLLIGNLTMTIVYIEDVVNVMQNNECQLGSSLRGFGSGNNLFPWWIGINIDELHVRATEILCV